MKGGREAFGFAALHIRDYSIYTPEVRTKEGADLEGDMNIAAAGCAFCHPERVRGISGLLSGSLLAALVRDDRSSVFPDVCEGSWIILSESASKISTDNEFTSHREL